MNYLLLSSLSKEPESKIEIQSIAGDAYATLGLTVGVSTRQIPNDPMSRIRVVPNPYNISAATELGFGELAQNRLYFFNIPGRCDIKIYSELGELIEYY